MPLFALTLFRLVPIRDWFYIGIIVAILGGVAYARSHWINQGKAEVLTDINTANAKAQGNADKGIKDVADCFNAGRNWNRTTGVCDDSAGQ